MNKFDSHISQVNTMSLACSSTFMSTECSLTSSTGVIDRSLPIKSISRAAISPNSLPPTSPFSAIANILLCVWVTYNVPTCHRNATEPTILFDSVDVRHCLIRRENNRVHNEALLVFLTHQERNIYNDQKTKQKWQEDRQTHCLVLEQMGEQGSVLSACPRLQNTESQPVSQADRQPDGQISLLSTNLKRTKSDFGKCSTRVHQQHDIFAY